MHGILIVNKPKGFTSFDVIAKLRGICQTRKIGHSGTLDPLATGVLPVFIGCAAKAVDLQYQYDKKYRAVMHLGIQTDTADITGTILKEVPVPSDITAEAIKAVLPQFIGDLSQVPPMYSAVKVNGVPLYKSARKGQTVQRKARPVTVHSLSLLSQESPFEYSIEIHCSKGTYVRTLIEDIGNALGVPAVMSQLQRIESNGYSLAQAHTLEAIQEAKNVGTLSSLLLPVSTVFSHLPRLEVSLTQTEKLQNGVKISYENTEDDTYALYQCDKFIGIGTVQNSVLKQKKLFCERE